MSVSFPSFVNCECIPELLWAEAYNSPADLNDRAYGVAVDAIGNIVVVGCEYRFDLDQSYNWRVRKYAPTGNLLWSQAYNSPASGIDYANAVAVDAIGNIVVVGFEYRFDLSQSSNARIRKYGPAGNLLWSQDYSSALYTSEAASAVAIDGSGNVVVAGYQFPYGLGQYANWLILKYDPAGNLLWSRGYNSPANDYDYAYGIAVDTSGNIVVVGYENRPDLDQDYNWRIRKYDASGDLLWSQDYNSPANRYDVANGVAIDGSGNAVVVGYESRIDLGQETNWLIREYDLAGNLLWSQDYNGATNRSDRANEVAIDGSGNIVVVGYEYGPDGVMNNWLIRKYACPAVPAPPVEIPEGTYQGTVRIFPNPFRRFEAARGTVKFEGLALGAMVRIYTVRGLQVWEGTVQQPYILEWNGRNETGKPVAPGTYLWVVESEEKKERGTLIVE